MVDSERPIIYANLKDGLDVDGLGASGPSSLLMAPLELQYTEPVLMNNYRSPLVLFGTKPLKKKLMGPLSGSSERAIVKKLMGPLDGSSERPNVKKLMGPLGGSSERTNVISQ